MDVTNSSHILCSTIITTGPLQNRSIRNLPLTLCDTKYSKMIKLDAIFPAVNISGLANTQESDGAKTRKG